MGRPLTGAPFDDNLNGLGLRATIPIACIELWGFSRNQATSGQ